MSTLVKESIQSYWSKSAQGYDKLFGHGIFNNTEQEIWMSVLSRNIKYADGAKILDVGCGTGFLSILLAELGFEVTGIDITDDMRRIGEAKALKKGLSISFLQGDAEHPDFEPNTFDVIISRHVFWTLTNPGEALANWKKLLKPGGAVVIVDGQWTPNNLSGRIRRLIIDSIRLVRGQKRHLSWKKEYVPDLQTLPFFGGAEPGKIVDLFSDKGFQDIWKDNLEDLLDYERRNGPLEFRLAHSQNRRYLIGGRI